MQIENILLIDDDLDDQLFFCDIVKEINSKIACRVANNGLEATEYLKESNQLPDLIFLDLNMPYMNGFDFLKFLRASKDFKQIPVIIFTTSNSEQDVELSRKSGANRFLIKPPSLEILNRQLSELLNAPAIHSSDDLELVH